MISRRLFTVGRQFGGVLASVTSIARFAPIVCVCASTATATGLLQDGAGARAMALGGAGTALADDPLSALFNNPAALSELRQPTAQVGFSAGFGSGEFHNRANARAELEAVGALGGAAFAFRAGQFHFGIGVNPDIAQRVPWRYRDALGGADGQTSYGVRTHASEIVLLRSALGVSWEVTPTFSLGASVGLLLNENSLHAPFVFQSQPVLRTAKVLLQLDTSGFGWNAAAGLRWRPVPALALSLSYTGRSRVETHGTASGNAGTQFANLGLGGARADFTYDATVTNAFPDQLSAGLAWQPLSGGRLTLGAQFDWVRWSGAFDSLSVHLRHGNNADLNALVGSPRLNDVIPLHWRDSFVGRLGVEQQLGRHWTLRAGYAFGSNPVPAGTLTPLTAAINEHTLSAGAGYRHGRYSVDAACQWVVPATGRVRQSELAAGEYSNSTTRISGLLFSLTTAIAF